MQRGVRNSRSRSAKHPLSAFPVHPLWTIRPPAPAHPSPRTPSLAKPQPHKRPGDAPSTAFHVPHALQKSASRIFLNCTKNTELTPRSFARTFSFVLNQKIKTNSAGDTNRRRHEFDDTNQHDTNRRETKNPGPSPNPLAIFIRHQNKTGQENHESNNAMDYLSHSLPGQSQTTHYQPRLHRCPRPATLRSQGRLSRRILRRRSPHRPSTNLRGHLCPASGRRNSRKPSQFAVARNFACVPTTPARDSHSLPAPHAQTSPTRTQPPQCDPRFALLVKRTSKRLTRRQSGWSAILGWQSAFIPAIKLTRSMIRARPQSCRQPPGRPEGKSRAGVPPAFPRAKWKGETEKGTSSVLEPALNGRSAPKGCQQLLNPHKTSLSTIVNTQ
jgi:hypothetical protein